MLDNTFDINFKRLAINCLPTFLRKPLLVAWVSICVAPLQAMFILMLRARKENLIRLNVTCQKYSLQKRLNDLFDVVERRIEIVSAINFDNIYLYTEAEDDAQHTKTKYLYPDAPIYLRTESELATDYDFVVLIPNTQIDQERLRAEIEYYMLQSKTYQIQII